MKILDIDAGNTRVKWRLTCDTVVICSGVIDNCTAEQFFEQSLQEVSGGIDRCRLSSVRSSAVIGELCRSIQQGFNIKPELPKPKSGIGGIVYDKADPRKLGDDRWLAMLGARRFYPEKTVMVVDSGTALTLDVINSQGVFQGGMICPGVGTMLKSLTDAADLLVLPDDKNYSRARAHNSVQAVLNGVVSMAAALVEREVQKISGDVTVVLCGGDAPVLAEQLTIPAEYCPDLVFDGLEVALP